MAEITTKHLGFLVRPILHNDKHQFKIFNKIGGDEIGRITYSAEYQEYRALLYQISWNHEHLAEVTEFVKQLQNQTVAV